MLVFVLFARKCQEMRFPSQTHLFSRFQVQWIPDARFVFSWERQTEARTDTDSSL